MDALARVEHLRQLSDAPWDDPWRARQALRSASDAVRGYCGWWVAPVRESTAVLSGNGSRVIGLPCLRVLAVHTVHVDGQLVAPASYRWSAGGVLERARGQVWPDDLANITVAYVGGWEQVPDDVVAVVCAVAEATALPVGVAAQSIDDQSVTYARGAADAALALTAGQRAILDRGFVVPPPA